MKSLSEDDKEDELSFKSLNKQKQKNISQKHFLSMDNKFIRITKERSNEKSVGWHLQANIKAWKIKTVKKINKGNKKGIWRKQCIKKSVMF